MAKLHSKEDFIEKATRKHGDSFDYREVDYSGSNNEVIIICKKHGRLKQTPHDHLQSKYGCPICAREARHKNLVCGVGYNDADLSSKSQAGRIWRAMLTRCYKSKQQSYIGCSVSEDWLFSSNFKEWFDANYIEGYALDKDIIKKGNKLYCEEFCCFVPRRINNLLTKNNRGRGDLPVGVTRRSVEHTYLATLNVGNGIRKKIGRYSTPEEAFAAYKGAKEAYIKAVAQEYYYANKIERRVYDALMNYEVEITD